MVCYEICNGEVIFMPDSCDDGKWEGGQTAANVRIIEDHQIFSTPPSSGDHDRVQSELLMLLREATENSANDRRHIPLDGNRHNNKLT
jgi:hypothetical protein